MLSRLLAVILFVWVTRPLATAEVTRVEVIYLAAVDLIGGKPFGAAGRYEKLTGRIYFEVDPSAGAPNKNHHRHRQGFAKRHVGAWSSPRTSF